MIAKQKTEKQKMRLQMLRLQEEKGSSLRVLGKENYERFINLQLPRMVDPDWTTVAEAPLAVEVP
jgi:hypothetical protein